jgi:ribose transport system substrate-binding protein
MPDNTQAIYMATSHLIKRGHENIALLLDKHSNITCDERLDGYKKALQEFKIDFREEKIGYFSTADEETEQEIHQFYEKFKPTAIVAGGNKLTLELLKALDSFGMIVLRMFRLLALAMKPGVHLHRLR